MIMLIRALHYAIFMVNLNNSISQIIIIIIIIIFCGQWITIKILV